MSEPEPADKAYTQAVGKAGRLLQRRAYSKAALVARLTREGCDQAAAEKAVANLAQVGFVNERRDIENTIGVGLNRGYGSLRIRAKLVEAGYDDKAIDHALQRKLPPDLELALAISWLTLKFRRTGKRDVARAFAALGRRGFPEDVARQAIERVLGVEE